MLSAQTTAPGCIPWHKVQDSWLPLRLHPLLLFQRRLLVMLLPSGGHSGNEDLGPRRACIRGAQRRVHLEVSTALERNASINIVHLPIGRCHLGSMPTRLQSPADEKI